MTKPTDTPPDVSLRPRQGAAALPSTDEVLGAMQPLAQRYGTFLTGAVVREFLDEARDRLRQGHDPASCWPPDSLALKATLESRLARRSAAKLRPVFNLTGTVLHTNLGRAPLPPAAVAAVSAVMAQACNLEYDIEEGGRGERDHLVETWLCQLTGAEAATVVNNNAAAVLLILNTLATRKEVVVSRGELIEIGGAFRIPDIMARAGARLREVGTTNRTHTRDYEEAINDRTAVLMKVHPSNYAIEGFTRQVAETDMAALAHRHELPLVVDLGSGSLVDLRDFGLPHEPTVRETLAAGADLVCFSGDKLLGGPQAGIVAGRADLIARLRKNPLKRALRVDKMTLAALEAVLRLHLNPGTLRDTHTGLRLLTRAYEDIHAVGERLLPPLSAALAGNATVDLRDCHSQIGSGSLPVDRLPSTALVISPVPAGKGAGGRLKSLEKRLRALPIPVIGRVQDGALWLDLRCLTDEAGFLGQLPSLHSC